MESPREAQRCGSCKFVEVHMKDDAASEWTPEADVSNEVSQLHNNAAVTLVFARADVIRKCTGCRTWLSTALQMPEFWWSDACRRTNGYFGCEDTYSSEGEFNGHNTWFRFLIKRIRQNSVSGDIEYHWYKFNIFTRWLPTGQTIAVIFDLKEEIQKKIPRSLFNIEGPSSWYDPYWIHTSVVEEVVRLQDESVWDIRDLVRDTEKTRTTIEEANPDYPRLHDISRHAIHVTETLDLATKTVNSVITHHSEFSSKRPSKNEHDEKRAAKWISDRLKFFDYMIRGLRFRNASNKERLTNEIQLAYNTVAQHDSRISVQIGEAAASDSAAMKTVAFVTLLFLPATFVSALFSMSFFNYTPASGDTPGKWSVSEKFWIYWVVSVPITIIAYVLWFTYSPTDPTISGKSAARGGSSRASTPPGKERWKNLLKKLDRSEENSILDSNV